MSENALSLPDDIKSLVTQDDKSFDKLTGSTYLPRLQLITNRSKIVESGAFPANHWGLYLGQDPTDVGTEVDALVVTWRAKAVDLQGDAPITCFDSEDELFKKIMAKSEEKDSGCMYGPEFLLYIFNGDDDANGTCCTFFCGTKSARRVAAGIKGEMLKTVTLGSKFIEGKKYSWTAPTSEKCVSPHVVPNDADWQSKLRDSVEKFMNPPVQEVKMAEDGDEGRER